MIDVNLIRADGGTQIRAELNDDTVTEYSDAMREGKNFPPVTLYYDGSEYWLADGFHRFRAAKLAGLAEIPEEITPGTRRDAILHSVGANANHGLRRTNADKRRAVETLLNDEEWCRWSDREIAKAAGVSHPFVATIRSPESSEATGSQRGRIGAGGRVSPATNETIFVETVTTSARKIPTDDNRESQNDRTIPADGDAGSCPGRHAEPAPGDETPHQADPAAPDPEEYDPRDSEIDELHSTVRELAAENEALKNREAAGGNAEYQARLDEQLERIEGLEKENGTLQASLAAVEASRDSYQRENGELKRQCANQRRMLDKLRKGD